MAEKLGPEKRHAFVHNGQKVFEWDQTLEEVNMYIELPKGVPTKLFHCTIQATHVEVGIRGNPPYLNHDLTLPVKTDSSFWTIVLLSAEAISPKNCQSSLVNSFMNGLLVLRMVKCTSHCKKERRGKHGHLQYKAKNPGFDFSQAQFTGTCPDPRTFMGGIRSD
uniref:CS domain-containing protein n=1 Tax=Oryza meridionalis TaxID=40149 RepID=A0A0E0C5T2_9ORYZ